MKTRVVVLGGQKLSALMQLQGGDAIEVRDITDQIFTRGSKIRRLYRYIRAVRDCDLVVHMFVTNRSVLFAHIAHLLHIGLVQMYTIFCTSSLFQPTLLMLIGHMLIH